MRDLYTFYASDAEKQDLYHAGLDSFDTLWNLDAPWFEEPNKRRKGWSGVITWPTDTPVWFIKRQENHNTQTLLHPFSGIPTYQREFKNIQLFNSAQVPTLFLSYYGERIKKGSHQAILITHALNHYQDLYSWYDQNQHNEQLAVSVMQKSASLIRHMHDRGLFHFCLYPNHIFIKVEASDSIDIKLIDLEKARKMINTTHGRVKDLDCLFRHTHNRFAPHHLEKFIETYLASPVSKAEKIKHAFSDTN